MKLYILIVDTGGKYMEQYPFVTLKNVIQVYKKYYITNTNITEEEINGIIERIPKNIITADAVIYLHNEIESLLKTKRKRYKRK
jgi:hypothetical protein